MLTIRRLFHFILRRIALGAPKISFARDERVDTGDADEKIDPSNPFPEIVQLEIRDSIDLHMILPRDIPAVVAEYLREARALGFQSVRVIHGKGKGAQRGVVRRILAETDFVIDYRDAPAHSGGWGATVAHLRIFENIDEDARSRDLR